jgi:hypothetical protein
MATATIEPPKQADQSRVSKGAVDSWMSALKEGAAETSPGGSVPATEPAPADPPIVTAPAAEPATPATKPAATAPTQPAAEPADKGGEPDKWPRSAQDWQKFIKVRDENYAKRDTRIKELEAKLSEADKALKGLPTDPATFETLKQERERFATEAKDLSERLRLAAIESHPKFKAYYDGKVTAQVELAKRVVGATKADAIAEALKLPDGAWKTARLEELSTDLSPVQASRLGGVLNAIEEIEAERRSEVARAKGDFETAQAKAAAESTAARERTTAEAHALFESMVKQAGDAKDGIALFQLKDGDEAWNKAVKERVDGARATLFGGTNGSAKPAPDNLIRKALLAEAFPALLENYNALLTASEALKAQVEKLTKATPTVEARTATGGPGRETTPSKVGSRPMDVAREWITGLKEASQG